MVVNPADISTKRKERWNKMNRVDRGKPARSLENKEFEGLYIPERLAEEYRLPNRYRGRLVGSQTRLKNRIKAVSAKFNYPGPGTLKGKRRSEADLRWLQYVRSETIQTLTNTAIEARDNNRGVSMGLIRKLCKQSFFIKVLFPGK